MDLLFAESFGERNLSVVFFGGERLAASLCMHGRALQGLGRVAEASVDLTGRVMQVGRGMIQGVSHQLFQQFGTWRESRWSELAGVQSGALDGDLLVGARLEIAEQQ